MRSFPLLPAIVAASAALIAITNVMFIVPQTKQALVLQFGVPIGAPINAPGGKVGPGLHVKMPLTQSVTFYDRRNMPLILVTQKIIAADQEQLEVDAYARWRIDDPLKFYSTVKTPEEAESRLDTAMISALKRVLGAVVLDDIISKRRADLMLLIRSEMNANAKAWGITIIDVRIRQADLPNEVAEQVFDRMRTQREQEAARLRANGDEEAAKIRADANKQVTVALATARQEAEKIRGDGDAKRAAIFARAYGRDPEFSAFYRSLQAYEKSIAKGTPMVIPPDGDFFRYLKNKNGR